MAIDVENINPQRFSKQSEREITKAEENDDVEDPIDEREIFGKFQRSIVQTIARVQHVFL